MEPSKDRTAYSMLAQLRKTLRNKNTYDLNVVGKILEKYVDINYAIPVDSPFRISEPNLIGCTVLHFAWHIHNALVYLLDSGADFTIKNGDSKTVLHMLVEQYKNIEEPMDDSSINAVLSAHVKSNNFHNPCNKDGLSHFHIACMTNNSTRAVEFFLNNGVPIDEFVSIASTFVPGYTPLHLAAMCTNRKVTEILLAYGANIHIEDASGKTPLHISIERRMQMFDLIGVSQHKKGDFYQKLPEQIQENDKIIHMLLKKMSSDNHSIDRFGLSNFHVACMLQDISIAEHLTDQVADINLCLHENSSLWPGYTALHFASHFNVNMVKMLINRGADVESKDSKGLTPLDFCIERYNIEDICSIISLNAKWKDVLFSGGATTLVSFIDALSDTKLFKQYKKDFVKDINMSIPMESPLWPGYTPLHLAVFFAERPKLIFTEHNANQQEMSLQILRFCLSQGADLDQQESHGQTPLHLAFRLNKETVVDILFSHSHKISNLLDEDNLSPLHILCAARSTKRKMKKCVLNKTVVNVAYKGKSSVNSVHPGATPLHVCLSSSKPSEEVSYLVEKLLGYGADPHVKDANGMTPIHWSLNCTSSLAIKKLLKTALDDCVAEAYGISYLHIAVREDNYVAAKRYLDNGADVNLAIKYTKQTDNDPLSFLSRYDKYTPLMYNHYYASRLSQTMNLVIKYGADVFAKKTDGLTPLDDRSTLYHFISKLWEKFELQNRLQKEYGWTKLHLACHLLKVERFEDLVKAKSTDVNAQVFSNSPIWKGYTPLHVLMNHVTINGRKHNDTRLMSKILLENGADVTKLDDEYHTPINMLNFRFQHIVQEQAALMIKYHKTYGVNPSNGRGISHFHIACYVNDVDAVEGFLSHGADVNLPIDFFSDQLPGCTPLHLTTELQVVEILISRGANIHSEDIDGNTVLHKAVECSRFDENVIKKIIESGAVVNNANFEGQTPFEIAALNNGMSIEKLKFFIQQGFHVNSCNPVSGHSYISMILDNYYHTEKGLEMAEIMMIEKSTNILGRTTLHHVVTTSVFSPIQCLALFRKLIKAGHDIDEQDSEGNTALHLAFKFRNRAGVLELLMCGADINVLDHHGILILSSIIMSTDSAGERIEYILIVHAYRLLLLKLDVNEFDMKNVKARRSIYDDATDRDFHKQVAMSKEIGIGVRSLCLYDFLSETSAISIYPYLSQSERLQIDEYFEALSNENRFYEIKSFLMLQYRKAVKRSELFFPAIHSLKRLLGFNLPELCAENIFLHLRNSDLKNIIQADI